MIRSIIIAILVVVCGVASAQTKKDIVKKPVLSAEEQYKQNITKSRINGVYIPKDLDDALAKLEGLSSKKGLEKFIKAPEDVIARRLHFGLGRWISYNWNFDGGSRYVEHLKTLGLKDPDHMIQFTIVSLHRKLNNKDLDIKTRVAEYEKLVQKDLEKRRARMVKIQ